MKVAEHENPCDVGYTDDCSTPEEECLYVAVIFPGIPCEFIHKMGRAKRTLTLINCERLTFLEGREAR